MDDKGQDGSTLQRAVFLRLDPAVMVQISELAKVTARTPSSLILDWVMERLALLSSDPVVLPALEVAREDPREVFRRRYRPRDIVVLFVGELAPADQPFFYEADSILYDATHEAFERSYDHVPGEAIHFFEWLRDEGFWFYDLVVEPPRAKRGRPPSDAAPTSVVQLAELLAAADPDHVIAVKTSLEGPVRQAAALAAFPAGRIRVLPYPLRQWRGAYVAELTQFLGGSARPTAPPEDETPAALHDAIEAVLRGAGGGPMPARRISNEISTRGLYTRKDGKRPDYQQVLLRARQHPDRFEVSRKGIGLRDLNIG